MMFKSLSSYIDKISNQGLHWPYLRDPTTSTPSITLLFTYITFVIAVGSVISLHFFPGILQATIVSIIFWVLSLVFYRLRRLDDVSLNIKSGQIEVKGDGPEKREDGRPS